MYILKNIFPSFLFLSLILNIVSTLKNVNLWNNSLANEKDYSSLNIEVIDSIAYDSDSDTELLLGKNSESESYFYLLENGNLTKKIKNTLNIEIIESHLIKYKNLTFFCSPSYLKVLYINGTNEINELYEIEKACNDKFPENTELKCLKMKNYIGVMYLNTHCFYTLNVNDFKTKKMTLYDGNYNYKAINIIQSNEQYSQFIILREIDGNYYLSQIKYENSNFNKDSDINFKTDLFKFYSKIEITPLTQQEVIIFTYDTEDNNNCIFYRVRNVDDYKIQINGLSNFLKFLNESKINSAGFIENTPLLYYSIKNTSSNEEYMGVADLINLIIIYNSEKEYTGKLFINNGFLKKEELYLKILNGKKIISYCPFIKGNDSCKYYVKENNFIDINYFSIKRNGSLLYNNTEVLQCEGKKIANFYCLDYCPIGYATEGDNKSCRNCFQSIDEQNPNYYSFKNKACLKSCNGNFSENNICFDCPEDKPIFFENQCISKCEEVYGKPDETYICIKCKDLDLYFDKSMDDEEICKKNCTGKKDEENKVCSLCDEDSIFFTLINECVSECPKYFIENNKTKDCELCSSKEYYIEEIDQIDPNNNLKKRCITKCIGEEYGINITSIEDVEINGKIYKLQEKKEVQSCEQCHYFKQGEKCVYSCNKNYYENEKIKICNDCDKYFVENINKDCVDKCPEYTKIKNDNICQYCESSYFYNNSCISDCGTYGLTKVEDGNIKYCKECTGTIIDGKCVDKCENKFYQNSNNFCKLCLCGDGNCIPLENNYKCDCKEDKHSYGDFCEFYSEDEINEKILFINTLNNRLIQTKKNYFTYNFKNKGDKLGKNAIFDWKVFLKEKDKEVKEVTNKKKYEKFFSTSTKESIFGINKDIFDYAIQKNKQIILSLSIIDNNKSYFHKIELKLNKYQKLNSKEFEFNHKGEQRNNEMKTLYNFKTQQNYKVNEMQYYFQYEFMDYYNERFPITNYYEQEEINFYAPYLKGFYINVKNDRDEILSIFLPVDEFTSTLNLKFEEISNSSDYMQTEKVYALISKLRNFNDQLKDKEIEIIESMINEFSEKINKNGYSIENNGLNINFKDNNRYLITYSEPKLITSLINYYLISQKSYLTKDDINNKFINYLNKIIENTLKEKNISNKTLAESDIKSFFRTLDNLYDATILIDNKNLAENNIFVQKFINILDNICKYLSIITYPSELIRLIGKRISLISFHFGEYQNNISFPFIDQMENITLNNFLNYSYDNYYLDENICSQENSTLFCFTEKNFEKLKLDLISQNYNLSNIIFNIYLLQDISKENEKRTDEDSLGHSESDENIEYIQKFKNYSYILKLYDKGNNKEITFNFSDILFEAEFPFLRELDEKEKEDKRKGKDIEPFYKNFEINITLYPNNSDFVCVPKNYYEKNKRYMCKTHFNYDENKVRCSCEMVNEILVIQNSEIANFYKNIQFPKRKYNLINIYSSKILLIIILLLLIPSIYYLITDIITHSKYINDSNNLSLNDIEDKRKTNYNEVKKYYNTGIIKFSLYLTLKKFPFFTLFNNYKLKYPKFIQHLVIYIGILIGFIFPLIPLNFIPFTERQIFIDQRDIKYKDDFITNVGPRKYFFYFLFYGLIGLILSHIFIYALNLILGFYQEDIDFYLKIKTVCKDYVYYEIKSEILLGITWKKVKLRFLAFYYICGNYILKHRKNKNNKFKRYLQHVARKDIDESVRGGNTKKILPKDISLSQILVKNESILEMTEKHQLLLEDEEEENNIKNNAINDSVEIRRSKLNNDSPNSQICKIDNFILDKNTKYDKSKRQIERYEKIRNKYIYTLSKVGLDEIEHGKEEIYIDEEKKNLHISHEINYSFCPINDFNSLKSFNGENKEIKLRFKKFIIISILLWVIFIVLFLLTLFLIKSLLDKFDKFIIKAWILPLIAIIFIANLIFYFIKILFGTLLIFYCYNLRKRKCFFKYLFIIFVDKSMIHIYKVRNLITKYKKEFDYL